MWVLLVGSNWSIISHELASFTQLCWESTISSSYSYGDVARERERERSGVCGWVCASCIESAWDINAATGEEWHRRRVDGGRRLPFCQLQERLLNAAPPPPPHPSNSPLHPTQIYILIHPLPYPIPPSFITTLNIVFRVTYYLESRNAKTICLLPSPHLLVLATNELGGCIVLNMYVSAQEGYWFEHCCITYTYNKHI